LPMVPAPTTPTRLIISEILPRADGLSPRSQRHEDHKDSDYLFFVSS
jgi:hypothetical protein